ncbi:hypothetical protein [Actinomadura gamaensis]|uniref:Adhesin domain-containing protein n=1 Tax=Actinomadura gamaensis TaxID=1763541 RepID=A0ABV9UBJ2_9ACTN
MSVTDERPSRAASPERPRRRGPWYGLAAFTALLVAVPTGLEIVGVQLRHGSDTTEGLARPVRAVEIEGTSASVTVRATAGPPRIRKELHWLMAKPRVRAEWDGATLKLRVTCGDGGFVGFQMCDATVTLDVPKDVPVSGRMSSGTLAVTGVTGRVDVRNSSGTLDLADLGGPLRARVGSGSINGERLSDGEAEVASGSGAIELGFVKAPARIVARTGSGAIDLGLPAGSHYLVSGHSGSGSRDIADGVQGAQTTNTLDVTSGSGAVSVHY